MISSTTWSLTEMCSSHLKVEHVDIDPDDTADYFDSTAPKPDRLMDFVRHCEADSYFQMAIANKVQALPLTKQLTNLSGNAWNRTLGGRRAERNEYILLHEFHKNKYICPDKVSSWEKKAAAKAADPDNEDGEEGGASGKKNSKRDKFKGGLVFEPKRGLWDKYVLVMDFNSLYPSIIQEFNIDFTTVDRQPCADVCPDPLLDPWENDTDPESLSLMTWTRFRIFRTSRSLAFCPDSLRPWSTAVGQSKDS